MILSSAEVKKMLAAPDMRTNGGYRNRIILEILYDTAIRRAEVASIRLHDLDLVAGYIRITGKGAKDRVVPLNRRVCELVQTYIIGGNLGIWGREFVDVHWSIDILSN